MALYHYKIGFPVHLNLPKGIYALKYGNHARREAMQDRYGGIMLPSHLNVGDCTPIEIEVMGKDVVKIVYRKHLDDARDLVIVVQPDGEQLFFVRTVWVNLRTDNHSTLNRERYHNPKQVMRKPGKRKSYAMYA